MTKFKSNDRVAVYTKPDGASSPGRYLGVVSSRCSTIMSVYLKDIREFVFVHVKQARHLKPKTK